MSFSWHGGDDLLDRLDGIEESGLLAGAEHLLEESNRICPIETGDLIRSGSTLAEGREAAVGYSSVYACRQHEELTWRHDPGRQAKYLETALHTAQEGILAAIAADMEDTIE